MTANEQHTPPPDRLLKVNDAIELLAIGRTTFNRLIRVGRLPAVWIDGARRVRQSDLDAFIVALDAERRGRGQ